MNEEVEKSLEDERAGAANASDLTVFDPPADSDDAADGETVSVPLPGLILPSLDSMYPSLDSN
jgi:hypothetical protein